MKICGDRKCLYWSDQLPQGAAVGTAVQNSSFMLLCLMLHAVSSKASNQLLGCLAVRQDTSTLASTEDCVHQSPSKPKVLGSIVSSPTHTPPQFQHEILCEKLKKKELPSNALMNTSVVLDVKLSHCPSTLCITCCNTSQLQNQFCIADIPSKLEQQQSKQEADQYHNTWCTLTVHAQENPMGGGSQSQGYT